MLEILAPLALLFVLLIVGVPVGMAMAAAGGVGILLVVGPSQVMALLGTTSHSSVAGDLLSTLPMYILMAEFLAGGTLVTKLFAAAEAWLSRLPGGLAVATIVAGAGMGALSGSSSAAGASLARISVPQMRQRGYQDVLSVSSVAAAGSLSVLIPPSIVLIVYGVTTETSISDLFAAAILPGILLTLIFIATVLVWARTKPGIIGADREPSIADEDGGESRVTWHERLLSLRSVIPVGLLLLFVLWAIYSGAMTVTEAGAGGALGALVVSVAFGGLRWKGFLSAVKQATTISAAIFIIMIGAQLFSRFVALTRLPDRISDWFTSISVPAIVVVILILLVYILLGMVLDALGMLLLTLPVFFPIVIGLGFDAIWFGIIIVVVVEMALLTPPVGLNVFIAAHAAGGDVVTAFKGIWHFVVADLLLVVLLVSVPAIVTVVPGILP